MKRLLQKSDRKDNEGRMNFKKKKNSFPEGIRKIVEEETENGRLKSYYRICQTIEFFLVP